MAQFKRKQFWIDSPLQLQMLGYVLLLVTLSLLLVSYSALDGLRQAAAAEDRKFFFTIEWVHEKIRSPMILASGFSILVSGIVTLLWSHRFAGPLRVLSAAMSRLKDGDFTIAPRVRQTDTHQDLVGEFAHMQNRLRERLEKDRRTAHEAVKKLEHAVKSHPSKELEGVIAELKSIGDGFQL